MKFKIIMTYENKIKRLRLFRVVFAKGKKQLSFSLEPKLFAFDKFGWPSGNILTVACFRIHYKESGGGVFV